MSETAQAYQWIDSVLTGDSALMALATGGVWQGFADIGTMPPYVEYAQQSESDVLTVNAIRLKVHILMRIKGVGPVGAGYAALVSIANRIDALFKDQRNIALSSGGILACYRESVLEYPDLVNGKQWSHLGGLYHIELQGV